MRTMLPTDTTTQAPLGLRAAQTTACTTRGLERERSAVSTPCGGWFSHPTHRWCTSCRRPPSHEPAETLVTSATYEAHNSFPMRGFPDETPPRLLPALQPSRAARTGSRDHERKIHLRPARPRRQAPRQAPRIPRRRGVWPDPPGLSERRAHLHPGEHGARAQALRHHRRSRRHDDPRGPARGPQADRQSTSNRRRRTTAPGRRDIR